MPANAGPFQLTHLTGSPRWMWRAHLWRVGNIENRCAETTCSTANYRRAILAKAFYKSIEFCVDSDERVIPA
jgi:hypothetical protein